MKIQFSDTYWKAVVTKIKTLRDMDACDVVYESEGKNVLDKTWTFKVTRYPDSFIKKFRAWFCARGNKQIKGVGFFDTYTPAVQWTTVCLMHILEVLSGLKSKQCDALAAFLHVDLELNSSPYKQRSNNPLSQRLSAANPATSDMQSEGHNRTNPPWSENRTGTLHPPHALSYNSRFVAHQPHRISMRCILRQYTHYFITVWQPEHIQWPEPVILNAAATAANNGISSLSVGPDSSLTWQIGWEASAAKFDSNGLLIYEHQSLHDVWLDEEEHCKKKVRLWK